MRSGVNATQRLPEGDRRAAVALAFAPGVGCATYRERVGRHGSAAMAFDETVPRGVRDAALSCADAALEANDRIGSRLLVLGEIGYPAVLLDLRDPPPFLFALGSTATLEAPGIAIVGTRHASPTGERTAHRLGSALSRVGACVVSGMARGIDAAAHRGALDAGGPTVAVLGGGVDRPYPQSHRALYEAIRARGLVISEALPGSPPLPGAFPRRNRIIAALGRALLVIEAGDRSGALITADQALDMGRPIGVVPGSIDAPQCAGSNQLLREGAIIITSPDDALVLGGFAARPPSSAHRDRRKSGGTRSTASETAPPRRVAAHARRDPDEEAVMLAVRSGASDLAELSNHTRLPVRTLTTALSSLELAGVLWTDHIGRVRLSR
jgi:DNA processing protein